jgi:signal transduction histidine kinase
MGKVQFKISARTAKLIGRENFSNPEGAIIELVKNCYDADAKNCLVIFDIVFDSIPNILTAKDFKSYSLNNPIIRVLYKIKGKNYLLINSIKPDQFEILQDFFFSKNSIYIIDNGQGMTKEVVEDQWMEIGTNNKEVDFTSLDGRVLTGAKGIGRFALDRLGYLSEMFTVSKKTKDGCRWEMNWKQFDEAKKKLSDINADIDEINIDLKKYLKNLFKGKPKILNEISKINFENGTIIKISNVKDNWYQSRQENVYKSLEALVPPKQLQIPFKVAFFSVEDLRLYGEVETAFFNDFDYKIEAQFNSKTFDVNLNIIRNELDIQEVKSKFSYLFKNALPPYDLKTLAKRTFDISKKAFELLKWEKDNDNVKLLKKLGDFSFTFYYLKNTKSKDYPYREFIVAERQRVLKKFGGIKIYRDSFRVRPYGDIGNDWLKLGERAAQSPAGAGQRIGDWRVGPNQVAGLVKISRLDNPNLIDKSDRGSLIENESFNTLKSIITDIINYFETDRSIILNPFYTDSRKKESATRALQIKKEAEKLADQIIEERTRVESKLYGGKPDLFTERKNIQEKEAYKKIIESGIQNIEKSEDEDAELAQVRTLASLGLIVTSFAHELKDIKNNLDELEKLSSIFNQLVPTGEKQTIEFIDGMDILELLKKDNQRISHWVSYSLTAIKKDKRKRKPLQFDKYFSNLLSLWSSLLEDRNIKLEIKDSQKKNYIFKSFEMDMNTIFNNLIANSIESFNKLKVIRKRVITISYKMVGDKMQILYSDNGIGLSKIFSKNVDEIFLPFVTAKKDKDGNDIGTGLGMYLVKTVVDDNNGVINILKSTVGFKVQIDFPIKKAKL